MHVCVCVCVGIFYFSLCSRNREIGMGVLYKYTMHIGVFYLMNKSSLGIVKFDVFETYIFFRLCFYLKEGCVRVGSRYWPILFFFLHS